MSEFNFDLGDSSSNVERGRFIPTKIMEQNLLSETSEACECFVEQKFSADLQSFLINYVISISGLYSVYA